MSGGWLKQSAAAGAEMTEGPPRTPDEEASADGRANGACLRLLAKALDLPMFCVRIAAGQRARCKTIHTTGASAEIIRAKLSGIIERPSR